MHDPYSDDEWSNKRRFGCLGSKPFISDAIQRSPKEVAIDMLFFDQLAPNHLSLDRQLRHALNGGW
jgi:hypothetical protein